MSISYTSERNTQILIALLKAHGIKRVIASPGGTNIGVVASLQHDPYFELYSCVDERSAAYMACGMAAESGEPVALSCTGATAARNYVPALTEAFYRKLPVLAITSSRPNSQIGHHIAQVTDRRDPMPDIVKMSVHLPIVKDREDEWECVTKVNNALLELTHHGGGPVHINVMTTYSADFSVKKLPPVRVIRRIGHYDTLPVLPKGQVAVYVGAHRPWSERLTRAVDAFCETYDATVLCDQTSNYHGNYRVDAALVACQSQYHPECCSPKTMIHIGEISGAYMSLKPQKTWRVSPDGILRDTFKTLEYVFEMEECEFFEKYLTETRTQEKRTAYFDAWSAEYDRLTAKIPELPFSNIWAAQQTAPNLPKNAVLHLGILSSLRAWNYFKVPSEVSCYCNTGGFGIDGNTSALLGASLVNKDKLYFGVVGDLSFFYDLNSIGNRHIGNNFRLMLINNGLGAEFITGSVAKSAGMGDDTYPYVAAKGHFGSKSKDFVRHIAEDLGFEYLSASDKEEYLDVLPRFTQAELTEKPMLLEVFTEDALENEALEIMRNLETTAVGSMKQLAKNILGEKGVQAVKKILNK